MVFIAISGFVIAGLVSDTKEACRPYIIRRIFRIFPVYLVILAIAFAALPLGVRAEDHAPWRSGPLFDYGEVLHAHVSSVERHPAEALLLQLSLMQGFVPDSLWPGASMAVLGPAWSLSLEWQFYLIAPACVWLMASERWRLATAAAAGLMGLAWHAGLFGAYAAPSAFPAAAYVFLIGIACRLQFDRIRTMPVGPEVIPLLLSVGLIYRDCLWLAIWGVMLVCLARSEAWRKDSAPGAFIAAGMDRLLGSPLAVYLGARSYSVYPVHMPVMMAAAWLIVQRPELESLQVRLLLAIATILATLLVSDFLYRCVERPMIALGRRLAHPRPSSLRPPEPAPPGAAGQGLHAHRGRRA